MERLQKPDTTVKAFWQDSEHFADIYNGVMFHGKSVLYPDQLTEQDSTLSISSVGKNRDLLQKFEYGTEFILLGIENQQEIHYAMPLRTMMYDGEGYTKEHQKLAKEYRKNRVKGTSAEFLSSMTEETRLHPIITLVIYYGKEPWTGPLSLEDMLIPIPDELKPYFNDYKLNLFQVRESDQYEFQNSDVKTVMELSRAVLLGDKQFIRETYHNKTLPKDLVSVVGSITKSRKIMKLAVEEEKEEVQMCAIEDWMEESRLEGQLAMIQGMFQNGIKIEQIEQISGMKRQTLSTIQTQVQNEKGEVQMCAIEDWMEESRLEGRLEGQSELIQNLFYSGMSLDVVEHVSKLPREILLEIKRKMTLLES